MLERTLAILKPDCIRKNLIGKVISHIEEAGFKIVALKMLKLTPEQAKAFYYVHREKPFYSDLVNFMTSDKVVVMVLEKENAVNDFRELIGATDPKEAKEGTIRKLYADNKQENIVHGSDSPENAKIEISFFFPESELIANQM
ncbi:nucleoside diphosphate kinase [Candidatus Kryptobacter tengchongensis]|uniref:Nucleoside diphosphate kinase n=1 Tax=Kryptobacter tengchongensis TaxID=1643429 RepID=A0A656CZB5_KRYT1|nr:nucleoside-diphosphate kinase [Candidatus Kryptobacter tengchongensis]CUS85779.1 nucleoside diphosphate kinase [Candidatus Kryptobacter tengchongensis]CUT00286.1 nucleoside diphosphate kinase [Candidatus Kryptobacter tengchongensis]CUU03297.1 nucleoside diphosphate kinase [Candidatus Kryptobacter tengchongensis]CUU10631.1 nucleoside diphosphate kinase [Candidatus Kryptobacter tengchongensis]